MKRTMWGSTLALLVACGSHDEPAGPATLSPMPNVPDAAASAQTPDAKVPAPDAGAPVDPNANACPLELHFAFVHGVGDPDAYARSGNDLADLEKSVLARIEALRPAYEATIRST